ncbi:MAG TPA: CTP synthase, partial [Caldisericia bacterium]|nr:CTP synthase [Caldisericia bacterium]
VYKEPLYLDEQGLASQMAKLWNILPRQADLINWKKLVSTYMAPKNTVKIGMIGKYTKLSDAYLSVNEALKHAGIATENKVEIEWVDAETLTAPGEVEKLSKYDGLLVPGGFGYRGIEGKIEAARYARENKIPYLGLCLGLQVMTIEFARHVCGLKNANSTEFVPETPEPVVDTMASQKFITDKGGTMRLGSQPCVIEEGTLAYSIYNTNKIQERHRHRLEINNEYKPVLQEKGMVFSGINPTLNLVEIGEITNHPFMIGVQYHPEFKSRFETPHPLFLAFIKAASGFRNKKPEQKLI